MMAGMMMAGWTHAAQPPIRFISHRGESMDAPENTMAAFRLSRERGVFGFECDIYMTADNEIICLHDLTLDRTTDGSGKPDALTLAELKKLDAGSWKNARFAGERIPTLAEALALACEGREIYIDIKRGIDIPRLVEVVKAEPKATAERIVFLGGGESVQQLRKLLPDYRALWVVGVKQKEDGTLTPSAQEAVAALKQMGAHGIDLQGHGAAAQRLIDKAYVRTIKDAGFSFHVWTINSAARAAELAGLGAETVTGLRRPAGRIPGRTAAATAGAAGALDVRRRFGGQQRHRRGRLRRGAERLARARRGRAGRGVASGRQR
jgi:glycerophosphoryl diester phosphodiesterase